MISVSTFASVLALVVCVNAAVGWIIFMRLTAELGSLRDTSESWRKTHAAHLAKLHASVTAATRTAPATLAAEVAALADAVASLKKTHQRFAGRFDQYVGQERAPAFESAGGSDRSYAGANQLDPEFLAELESQSKGGGAPPT